MVPVSLLEQKSFYLLFLCGFLQCILIPPQGILQLSNPLDKTAIKILTKQLFHGY